jgi:hypothetical protein
MTPTQFAVSITTEDFTGEVISVYFQIRRGKVHETREFTNGAALADYNRNGELLGIELLEPCRVSIVDQLAANEPAATRRLAKSFMRRAGPREMIAA